MQKQVIVKLLFGLYARYQNQCNGKGIIVLFHAQKAHTRHRSITPLILNLGTMEMIGYLHAPAARTPVPILMDTGILGGGRAPELV